MEPSERDYVKTELERRLFFVEFADIHFISAKHGTGVGNLYKSVQASFTSAVTRWPTSRLTQILEDRSEEHTSELQSLMRISYAVFCLKKKNNINTNNIIHLINHQEYQITNLITT